jgi:hypothetical protein
MEKFYKEYYYWEDFLNGMYNDVEKSKESYFIEKSYNLKEIQPKLDREQVKEMFLCGMKQIQIANYFNASKGTICDILKSFGLTRKMEDILVNREKVIELNSNGEFNKDIEKENEN